MHAVSTTSITLNSGKGEGVERIQSAEKRIIIMWMVG